MKKRQIKVISLLLCVLMLAPCVLVGCRKDSTNEPKDSETKPTAFTEDPNAGGEDEPSTLIIYPEFDERIQRDYMYSVSVTQGEKTATLPVYNHSVADGCTRNPLDTSSNQNRRFSTFAFDPNGGQVRVDIRVNRDFESYSIIPSAKQFKNQFHNGVISVYLDKPDYFVIRLNDMDSTILSVFADEPETEIPKKGSNTIIVDGWMDVDGGLLSLTKPGTTVYVKPGAVLNARIKVNADNCRIIGRGAILDPCGDLYHYDETDYDSNGFIWVRNANDTKIDGVHLLNSYGYNIFVQGVWERTYSKNTSVTNTKILSTEMCSDGITFSYYNKNSRAEHCFVYCGDNALVYEDEANYKDILIGTTCSAMYPQTAVRNSTLEDIYVFRSDDNIIRSRMDEGDDTTPIDNSTITNLYLQDVISTNSFLHITEMKSPAVSTNGGFTIKNVYLSDIKGYKSIFYRNVINGNYEVNLINVSVDGVLIPSISLNHSGNKYSGYVYPSKNWGWIQYPDTHKFTYSTTADFDPNVKKNLAKVDYKNDLNVLIGVWQVYYAETVLREGNDILLPLKQTQQELRTGKSAAVIERNGIQYVTAASLVESGMAKAVKTDGNTLTLTPNYSGENLILLDSGILTQFGQSNPGAQTILGSVENGATVLHIKATASSTSYGLYCLLNEAIKKYGAGSYRLTFKAKSNDNLQLTAGIAYGSGNAMPTTKVTAGANWTEATLNFSVSSVYQKQLQIRLIIDTAWARDTAFDLTDICLIKVS